MNEGKSGQLMRFGFLMQIVIWIIIPAMRSSSEDHNNNALVLIVLFQYVPRLYVIFPLSHEIIKASGVVTKTAWGGAAYNLVLYMLASHVCAIGFSPGPFDFMWLQFPCLPCLTF